MTIANMYVLDTAGTNPANLIQNELHSVQPPANIADPSWFPVNAGPFFKNSFELWTGINRTGTRLIEGQHFRYAYQYLLASLSLGKPIFGAIALMDRSYTGNVYAFYQTLGGPYVVDSATLLANYVSGKYNIRTVVWDQIQALPDSFPPIDHSHDPSDFSMGMGDVVAAILALRDTMVSLGAMRPSDAYTSAIQEVLALYGVGSPSLSTTNQIANLSLNTVVLNGDYNVGANCSDLPQAGAQGYLLVRPATTGLITQLFILTNAPVIAYRSFVAGTGPFGWNICATVAQVTAMIAAATGTGPTFAPVSNPVFTGQVQLPAGTAAVPGLSFSQEPAHDTGIYWLSDGVFAVTNNGAPTVQFAPGLTTFLTSVHVPTVTSSDNSTNAASTAYVQAVVNGIGGPDTSGFAPKANPLFSGQVILPNGSPTVPSLTFTGDQYLNTGFYWASEGVFVAACNGGDVQRWINDGQGLSVQFPQIKPSFTILPQGGTNPTGGGFLMALGTTGTQLNGAVVQEVYSNGVRWYETGGTNRGCFLDLSIAGAGDGSRIAYSSEIATLAASTTASINSLNNQFAGTVGSALLAAIGDLQARVTYLEQHRQYPAVIAFGNNNLLSATTAGWSVDTNNILLYGNPAASIAIVAPAGIDFTSGKYAIVVTGSVSRDSYQDGHIGTFPAHTSRVTPNRVNLGDPDTANSGSSYGVVSDTWQVDGYWAVFQLYA